MNNKRCKLQSFKKKIILIKVTQKKSEKEREKRERKKHLNWQERKINKSIKSLVKWKKSKDKKTKRRWLVVEINNLKKKEWENDKRKLKLQIHNNNKFNTSLMIGHLLNNLLMKVLLRHLINNKMKMLKLLSEKEDKREDKNDEKKERK